LITHDNARNTEYEREQAEKYRRFFKKIGKEREAWKKEK